MATELRIKDMQFMLNGTPTFLLGISYYSALGAPQEFILLDLADMLHYCFNWIRVWVTWSAFGNDVSVVDRDGNDREPFLAKLKWLVAECDRRGMVVDITLSRGNSVTGVPRLQTLDSHQRAIKNILTALKPYRNWYLDASNERNIRDERFVSFHDLKQLCQLAKELDPQCLVTTSHAGDIERDEMREYLQTVKVSFISPHRPRHPSSPAETEAKSCEYFAAMKELGLVVPIHYQEPFRRDFGEWQPKAEDFVNDAHGAKAGGAAGWCFHQGADKNGPDYKPRRSFDLREKRLFNQLDDEELRVLEGLRNLSGVHGLVYH